MPEINRVALDGVTLRLFWAAGESDRKAGRLKTVEDGWEEVREACGFPAGSSPEARAQYESGWAGDSPAVRVLVQDNR